MTGDVVDPRYLELLDPDPDVAAARYRDLFTRLVRFFEWRGCRQSEDLAQETLRRGFSKMRGGAQVYTPDPGDYFIGIARNVVRETWKVRPLEQADDAVLESGRPQWSRPPQTVETALLLRECLSRLEPHERELILRYHLGDRDQLRAELGIDDSALRVRVHRAIAKARQLLHLPVPKK